MKEMFTGFTIAGLIFFYGVAHPVKTEAQPSPFPVAAKAPGSVDGPALITYVGPATPEPEENITVKVSHYSPALGGVNCATFKDGRCVSKLANGEDWEKYIDTKSVIACPKELKLGTKIKILGRIWTCKDRGGMIKKTETGAYWVDQLTRDTVIPYGYEVEAQIIK